ncbi:MAG: alpha/beta hydrolase [Solirubrobacteraceae bacterium]
MAQAFAVASGSASLACERVGQRGPVVVFLHAGVADRRSWRAVASRVAAAGAAAVSFDRRGFGETGYAPEPHRHADDLLSLLDAVADGPAWLVGSSQGGRVAIDLALSHPDRVAGLVLFAPAVSGAPELVLAPAELQLEAQFDAAEAAGDLDLLNRLEAHVWLDGPAQPEGRVGGPLRELFLEMNGRALAADDPGPELEPPDAIGAVERIACPALVVWGDLDFAGIVALSASLAERLPAGRGVTARGTAHLPYLERPDEAASLVAGAVVAGR